MALRKTIVMPQGYEVENAYHRIESLTVHPKDAMTFMLRGYADVTKPSFIEFVMTCEYSLDGDNPIKQAYEFLKTTSEFDGAEDC
jgi:hypothetical protein